jgi:hypothetical protein
MVMTSSSKSRKQVTAERYDSTGCGDYSLSHKSERPIGILRYHKRNIYLTDGNAALDS